MRDPWPTCPECHTRYPSPNDLAGADDAPKTWTEWVCADADCGHVWPVPV